MRGHEECDPEDRACGHAPLDEQTRADAGRGGQTRASLSGQCHRKSIPARINARGRRSQSWSMPDGISRPIDAQGIERILHKHMQHDVVELIRSQRSVLMTMTAVDLRLHDLELDPRIGTVE